MTLKASKTVNQLPSTHEMKISTTTAFYNNADFGGTSGKEIFSIYPLICLQ